MTTLLRDPREELKELEVTIPVTNHELLDTLPTQKRRARVLVAVLVLLAVVAAGVLAVMGLIGTEDATTWTGDWKDSITGTTQPYTGDWKDSITGTTADTYTGDWKDSVTGTTADAYTGDWKDTIGG